LIIMIFFVLIFDSMYLYKNNLEFK
jgi:hypothetical protein